MTTIIGPPLGGAAIGLLGPVVTVLADAASYLLSAFGIRAAGAGAGTSTSSGGQESQPERREAARTRAGDLLDGWRYILADPALRPLFFNAALFNGLIMAAEPLLAVLLLGRFGYAPWQYGLAFAAPAIGGLIGSRLARPLVAHFDQHRILVAAGTLRALWPVGLAFLTPGSGGLMLMMGVEFGLILCCGVFNPVQVTFRLERTAPDRVARTLTAWSVTTKASIALLTALWGVLGALLGLRTAIGLAGVLVFATPFLLPRRTPAPLPAPASGRGAEPASSLA
jgi:hypothetical protein